MAFQFVCVLTSSPWFVVLDQILNPDNLALRYLKIWLKVSSGSEKCVNIIILFVLVFIQSIVGFPINKKEKEVWEQKKHLLRHFLWMWESYGPPKYWLISPRKKNFFLPFFIFVFSAFTFFPVVQLTNFIGEFVLLQIHVKLQCWLWCWGLSGGRRSHAGLSAASGTELQKPETEERCALPAVWYSLVYGNDALFFLDFHF